MLEIFSILVIMALVFHAIGKKLNSYEAKRHAEIKASDKNYQIKKRMEKKEYKFLRVNGVEGVLQVDGKSYRTFNGGTLRFGEGNQSVQIEMSVTLDDCFISDIYIAGHSIQSAIPYGLSDDDDLEYMLGLIDQAAVQGIIEVKTASRTRRTVNDFFYFADLLRKGTIAILPNKTDYVWMGEAKN